MKFIIQDQVTGEDVLGGPISEDNAYLTMYAVYKSEKRPTDLKLGRKLTAHFSQSFSSGFYDIRRVE